MGDNLGSCIPTIEAHAERQLLQTGKLSQEREEGGSPKTNEFIAPNGMWAHWSSSLIAPVARRRDTLRLTSSSKKMRLPASIARFGMNLRLRLARHMCGINTTYECRSIEALQS